MGQEVFVHLFLSGRMPPSVYKSMLVDFMEICKAFKDKGIPKLNAFIEVNKPKEQKLISMFGFNMTDVYVNHYTGQKYIRMEVFT